MKRENTLKQISKTPEKVSFTLRFVKPEIKKTIDAINVKTFKSPILFFWSSDNESLIPISEIFKIVKYASLFLAKVTNFDF